ncbi:MAG TPA: hypothetical protein VNU92_07205 [Edaphobacter sp.]|jgi:hypothetical protein|nr:hypothetical protein [Edaphobacter sp.]
MASDHLAGVSMMNDVLKSAIPALIALTGTTLTIFVGYRQWKGQQDASRNNDFQTERQRTYKELWEKLEDLHVRLRTEVVGGEEFHTIIRDINSYMLKRGLYLETDDQTLANEYLSKVREFTGVVAASDSADAKAAVSDTRAFSPAFTSSVQKLAKIQTEVDQIRGKLVARYRAVLSAKF